MRTILILILLSFLIYSQTDFNSLDIESYNYFLKGDYENLKNIANKQFSLGYDYYYLRMRLGILAFNYQYYQEAFEHFNKALKYNFDDPITNEYIYYCYLYSGRPIDALQFLTSLSNEQKTDHLRYLTDHYPLKVYSGFNFSSQNSKDYLSNFYYYEAIDKVTIFNLGLDAHLSNNTKINLAYNSFNKKGKFYNFYEPEGDNRTFNQNQFYIKMSFFSYPGFEFYGFTHMAVYQLRTYKINSNNILKLSSKTENDLVYGLGFTKNFWKTRYSINASFSDFGNSNQTRGELNFTYLPNSNLNFYTNSNVMVQFDKHWGTTYQAVQEIGFKTFANLWLEAGISVSNSFLNSTAQGYLLNNSYSIPNLTLYTNAIFLVGNNFTIKLTPYFINKYFYSFDLLNFKKYDKVSTNAKGVNISIIYNR